ncbi:hypothetical protein P152DRAFT_481672 [Eremomyces bilateralis CBS 781.70]|uniref:BZIP domain-containing protein n=1 Tax=Eremomyces bilateralis CBS 781.70 TaxID=1392243 RepID=A0A6G1G3U2_9PEZI|nr:uncharacterized protein P152DRAFT_481672 [Eremomyces bilateralis CBS 781.70]KAF1812765.1 hypothetical protein P152DRAFT_481672 [Eremomyces bilateralis CBS 781.70]
MVSNTTGVRTSNRGVGRQGNARKKQTATDGKTRHEQERINRKREQNRISQQCLRERQLAHSKQLETLASIMKISTGEDADHSSLRAALMSNQLALIEENKDLREALLRMRKKTLSLSAALSAVADDAIFDKLFSKTSQEISLKRKAKNISSLSASFAPGSPLNPALSVGDAGSDSGDDRDQIPAYDEEMAMQLQRQKHRDLDGMSLSLAPETNSTPHGSLGSSSSHASGLPAQKALHTSGPAYNVRLESGYVVEGDEGPGPAKGEFHKELCFIDPMLNLLDWGADMDFSSAYEFFPQIPDHVPAEIPRRWLSSQSEMVVWRVEEACLWYLLEELGLQGHGVARGLEQPSSCYEPLRAAIATLDNSISYPVVAIIAKAGISLTSKMSGLTNYLYGVGANESMEKVLLWRLAANASNRTAISEPFKPTPLQFMRPDHPLAISFVNWPSIRDQLIYKQGTYELSGVCHDIVLHTVIEFPEFHAAINIHDAFITRVFSQVASSLETGSSNSESSNFSAEFEGFMCSGSAPGTEEIFQCLKHTMQQLPDPTLPGYQPSSTTVRGSPPFNRLIADKQPLSSRWGLDNLDRWKLSKEFEMAYPWLDCTGVTALYPMYSSRILPEM